MISGNDLLLIPVGLLTGFVGTVSGGASLISFPALLALGYPPLVANVTNAVSLPLMSLGGALGYRKILADSKTMAIKLSVVAFLGGFVGGVLLIGLGETVFKAAVPAFLIFGAIMLLLQPRMNKRLMRPGEPTDRDPPAIAGTFAGSIYGGYFGPGLGTVLTGLYSTVLVGGMQRAIALKSIVSIASNIAASIVFIFFAPVDLRAAAILGVGGLTGGYIGAHAARRMSDSLLRYLTVAVAITAAIYVTVR